MTQAKTIFECALEYHQRGWCVIPIPWKKKEATIHWKKYQKERPTEADLCRWFGGEPCNLAVIVGPVSGGLTCRDFDEADAYEKWATGHPELAKKLPTAKTGRGYHVYFMGNATGIKKYKDGELRGSGGYCLLPPSVHRSGTVYEWLIPPEGDLPEIDPSREGLCLFTEETEDIEDTEVNRSNEVGVVVLDELEPDLRGKIKSAISGTLPTGEGQRNHCIFRFCQWLKGIGELSKLPCSSLKPIVRLWHEQALPAIATKPFTETWADFTYAWPRVKWPKGDDALRAAAERAMATGDPLPEAAEYDMPDVQLLVRICLELQLQAGDTPFFLSCRCAGGILGVSQTQANKWLQMLASDGILRIEEEHTSTRATRFRYLSPSLTENLKGGSVPD